MERIRLSGERIICDRCGEWHQRLIRVFDVTLCEEKLECLDCLSELLVGRRWDGRLKEVTEIKDG